MRLGETSQRTLVRKNPSLHDLGSGFQHLFLCFQYIYGILQLLFNVINCFSVTLKNPKFHIVGIVGRYRVEMKTSNFNINTPEHGKK